MAAASLVGCSFCLDFNYFKAHNKGLDVDKAREVPRVARVRRLHAAGARRAGVRRGDEPDAADGDRRAVGRGCSTQLGAPALVELTASIAAANMVSRANVALGIESQGFAAACGLQPLATRRRE